MATSSSTSSTSSSKNILIVGATGWLGTLTVDELLKKKEFSLRILIRSNTKESKKDHVERWIQQGATIVEGDLNDESSLLVAMEGTKAEAAAGSGSAGSAGSGGIDTVISFIGGAALFGGEELKLVNAAKKAGVKRFIPSEYGLDSFAAESDPIFQAKIDSKKAIKEAGMDYTFIFTGMFYEYFFTSHAGF